MTDVPPPLPFIGRQRELAALAASYASPRGGFWPVYGPRRAGKSTLIQRFTRTRPTVYLLGKKGASAEQYMRELLQGAALALEAPSLATAPAQQWKPVIEAILSCSPRDQKLIIVLDEVQWIAGRSPDLTSRLQQLWDHSWQHDGRVFLILCSSNVGFMERDVLGRYAPLFGRRSGQIVLRPFGYREAALCHPRASLLHQARSYFICGGIPHHLRFFPATRPVLKSIETMLLPDTAPLHAEVDRMLGDDLHDRGCCYKILGVLAGGSWQGCEIGRRTGIDPSQLDGCLEQLTRLGYLNREYPLSGKVPDERDGRYCLVDPLLRFWFRFVYPNTGLIGQLGPQRVAREIIEPHLDAYFGRCFADLCREALPAIYVREGPLCAFETGAYWNAETQIDVVGRRERACVDLGECNWSDDVSVAAAGAALQAKARHYPLTAGRRKPAFGCRLFARSFKRSRTAPAQGVRLHTLEDLYRE